MTILLPNLKTHAAVRRSAFTLLELLVVITIVSIVAMLALPSVRGLLNGSSLTSAAKILVDQLANARQIALTKNHMVEVRIYQFAISNIPGEQPSQPSSGKYRAVQCFEILSTGTAIAIGKMQILPAWVIMDSGATLSSILGNAVDTTTVPAYKASPQVVSISNAGVNYNSVSFRFLPTGGTNLSPIGQWFLTLYDMHDARTAADKLKTPPPNFATIQIDPINGHVQNYRP